MIIMDIQIFRIKGEHIMEAYKQEIIEFMVESDV
jgi:hypothetical protein